MTVIFGVKGADGRQLAHPLLNRAAALLWGWTRPPELERSPRGKPYFAGRPDRWLSLSHSGGYALCALSEDGEVGVDIEVVRPHRPGLPAYALTEAEQEAFDGSWEEFTRLWTRKESWVKRTGGSIAGPSGICPPLPGEQAEGVLLDDFSGAGWRAAVCAAGAPAWKLLWRDHAAAYKT